MLKIPSAPIPSMRTGGEVVTLLTLERLGEEPT